LSTSRKLAKADFEALSEFRYQLRRFLRFSELAVEREDLTLQQYLLLLHLKGLPGRDTATVGQLAERLQVLPHGALALVKRCEEAGLVSRADDANDRRLVWISMTPYGEAKLRRLAGLHRAELNALNNVFQVADISAFNDEGEL
jgi:DNA-binding MarR family transcriptional regulator